MSTQNLEVKIFPVLNKKDLDLFIKLPWKIYSRDPAWVPPLVVERKMHLTPENPFLERASYKYWLAYKDNRVVGRISAQIDPYHEQLHKEKCGYFGMLEAEDDSEVFNALLETAESWLKYQNQEIVRGPFNLSINDEVGLLVDGFDTPPNFMMGHAPKYYISQIQDCGYRTEKDLLAYRLNTGFSHPFPMRTAISRTRDRIGLRCLDKKDLFSDISILQDIFNDAWSGNWGFVPFTEKEFQELGKQLKYIVSSEYVQIAEVDNQPAAMLILLPNFNELIQDFNGRLFPLNWLRLLVRMKYNPPKSARVPLMGVKKKYQNTLLGAALVYRLIESVQPESISRGVKEVELSWVLEDNQGLKKILSTLGAKVYKRYRVLGKKI